MCLWVGAWLVGCVVLSNNYFHNHNAVCHTHITIRANAQIVVKIVFSLKLIYPSVFIILFFGVYSFAKLATFATLLAGLIYIFAYLICGQATEAFTHMYVTEKILSTPFLSYPGVSYIISDFNYAP